jgi:hypothetical protein
VTIDLTLAEIARHFRVRGDFVSGERYGTGHINETYLARYCNDGGERRYIHQRINDRIFSDVPALMENIGRVTRHLPTLTPAIVQSVDGADVVRAGDGSWWRTYEFIEGARTYDKVERPEQAYEAARAFGKFALALVDLPGRLRETIPSFHDTKKRYADLLAAVDADVVGRASSVEREIDYCVRNAGLADALDALRRDGIARECVTHNDTKVNNVMLDDASGKGVCVIDLDTVMPGLALYDFGDMVRTATMPVAEDERPLSLVAVRDDMFEALARGYIEGAGPLLSPHEREHFVTAGKVMTFECGMRFLSDHIAGDAYFRIHRPGQNLDRARTQFALIESLSRQEAGLRAFIDALP